VAGAAATVAYSMLLLLLLLQVLFANVDKKRAKQ
jgi:hypothetical protein